MPEVVEGRLCLLEVMRRVLLCVIEAVEGELCLLDVLEVKEGTRGMLVCMLEAVEGGLCLLETLEVLEAMRCMLETAEGELRLLDVLDVLDVEAMRYMLLCTLEAVEGGLCFARDVGGDALCAALYAG